MDVFLMRHGDAGAYSLPDSGRQLTERGRDDVFKVLSALHGLGVVVRAVASSSYCRARQTAEIAATVFGLPEAIPAFDAFTPDAPPREAMEVLERISTDGLLVTMHQPLISHLVSLLVHGDANQGFGFETGTCVCLSMDFVAPACATLKWARSPNSLTP